MEISSGKPYKDIGILRLFEPDVNSEDLVWHRDKEDRKVEVIEGEGWQFQFDNQMPVEIEEGDVIEIPKYSYHRLIKGNSKLILQIEEK